jgi:hypothetical protein
MKQYFHYDVFGLHVVSEMEFSGVERISSSNGCDVVPDVEVSFGKGSFEGDVFVYDEVFSHSKDVCKLTFPSVGTFFVKAGRHIVIQDLISRIGSDLEKFLFGSVFSALLYQRQRLTLHVSAVMLEDKCVAFTGQSGAGKSTMAAYAYNAFNCPVICDDVATVVGIEPNVEIIGAPKALNLSEDSAHLVELRADDNHYDVRLMRYQPQVRWSMADFFITMLSTCAKVH